MERIITATEFATFRKISKKIDVDKINEAIELAQQTDLINILGDFYFDVIQNISTPKYAELLDGCIFEYNGQTFEHVGIKRVLADLTYARYVYTKPINDTSFALVYKDSNDSTPIDRNMIKDLAKQAQFDAGVKFKFVEKYIYSEPVTFARFCKTQNLKTSFSTQKLSKL